MTQTKQPRVRRMGADAGRRDRIAEAALVVIRDRGVSGLTHRAVATEADVPLGSTTYHFATMDEILEAAFAMAMARDTDRLRKWAARLTDESDIAEELASLVIEQAENERDTLHVNYELALAAVHRPRLRRLSDEWTMLMASLVAPYVGDEVSETVSAVYEGTVFRQIVSAMPPQRARLVGHFRRACGFTA